MDKSKKTIETVPFLRVGLALSGGGARGIAHLGVAKALMEVGIRFSAISGASAGAIVGAFLAKGYLPEQIFNFISSIKFLSYVRPSLNGKGILSMAKMEKLMLTYFPDDDFESLKIPLTVVATDILAGKTTYFNSGPLIKPVLASSSIPGIFEPITFRDVVYTDGGTLNNLPIEPLIGQVDLLIGSNCNPVGASRPLGNMRDIVQRSLLLAANSKTHDRLSQCHIKIEPPELSNYDVFDIRKAREIFRAGYEYVKKNPELIRQPLAIAKGLAVTS